MAPRLPADLYEQYEILKDDTREVFEWLCSEAARIAASPPIAARDVSTRLCLSLATTIVDSCDGAIPMRICKLAQDAADRRRKVSKHYMNVPKAARWPSWQAENDGHNHFTQTLERVHDILQAARQRRMGQERAQHQSIEDPTELQLPDRLASLAFDTAWHNSMTVDTGSTAESSDFAEGPSSVTDESSRPILQSLDEAQQACLPDLGPAMRQACAIRTFMRNSWNSARTGKISYLLASEITVYGIQVVQHLFRRTRQQVAGSPITFPEDFRDQSSNGGLHWESEADRKALLCIRGRSTIIHLQEVLGKKKPDGSDSLTDMKKHPFVDALGSLQHLRDIARDVVQRKGPDPQVASGMVDRCTTQLLLRVVYPLGWIIPTVETCFYVEVLLDIFDATARVPNAGSDTAMSVHTKIGEMKKEIDALWQGLGRLPIAEYENSEVPTWSASPNANKAEQPFPFEKFEKGFQHASRMMKPTSESTWSLRPSPTPESTAESSGTWIITLPSTLTSALPLLLTSHALRVRDFLAHQSTTWLNHNLIVASAAIFYKGSQACGGIKVVWPEMEQFLAIQQKVQNGMDFWIDFQTSYAPAQIMESAHQMISHRTKTYDKKIERSTSEAVASADTINEGSLPAWRFPCLYVEPGDMVVDVLESSIERFKQSGLGYTVPADLIEATMFDGSLTQAQTFKVLAACLSEKESYINFNIVAFDLLCAETLQHVFDQTEVDGAPLVGKEPTLEEHTIFRQMALQLASGAKDFEDAYAAAQFSFGDKGVENALVARLNVFNILTRGGGIMQEFLQHRNYLSRSTGTKAPVSEVEHEGIPGKKGKNKKKNNRKKK
ncbi:unnamed protein product [Zymoseptoria tritici ST99CH_3D7]|uniref:DUF6604 domain-containing protein n=1 Tax=Zymoseptoria tritici (strain ST99CH_3D7) TaxID=1276538 RepID=A0A1X7RDJ8_ZYMT9|nr:unnamed protein product [Zymoseptoria tritici ST99CH_3D7]